jgi:thymidine kinase
LQLEVIGGAEKYMAVCRKCFFSQVTGTSGSTSKEGA